MPRLDKAWFCLSVNRNFKIINDLEEVLDTALLYFSTNVISCTETQKLEEMNRRSHHEKPDRLS